MTLVKSALSAAILCTVAACEGSGELTRFDRTPAAQIAVQQGTLAETKHDQDGILTAGLVVDGTTTQIIRASKDSAIATTEVSFPPGSVAISVDITVKPGSTAFSQDLEAELGLGKGTSAVVGGGVPVEISASAVIQLGQAFVVAVDLPAAAGLVGLNLENVAVLYQVKKEAEGKLESGLLSAEDVTIRDGRVLFSSLHFGWFRAVLLDKPLQKKLVVAESKAKSVKGLMLVQSLVALPSCGTTDVGVTVYVKEETAFKTCTAAGWESINLTGPAGQIGAQGPQGTAGTAGPAGANGTNGTNGTNGANGATGPTGPAGPPLKILDKNGAKVGDLVDADFTSYSTPGYVIMLSNDALFRTSLNGNLQQVCRNGNCGPWVFASTFSSYYMYPECFYQSSDCSGACLSGGPLPGFLYRSAGSTGLARYAGAAPLTSVVFNSVWAFASTTSVAGGCVSSFTYIGSTTLDGYELQPYTPPAGFVGLPLQGPLSIGKN